MSHSDLEYLFPGMTPVWMSELQRAFGWTHNRVTYAITDVKKDLTRWEKGEWL